MLVLRRMESIRRYFLCFLLALFPLGISFNVFAETLELTVTVPDLAVEPYHRPYVSIWLETANREGVGTLVLWADADDWYKDLRQWWRKLGRASAPQYDAVTAATRKPGQYMLSLDLASYGLTEGTYWLMIEASREEGGREFLKQPIQLGQGLSQAFFLQGKKELGQVKIKVH